MKSLPAAGLPAYVDRHQKTHIIFDFDATLLLLKLPWHEWGETMRDDMRALDDRLWLVWERDRNLAGVQNQFVAAYGDKARERIIEHNEHFEQRLAGVELHDELIAITRQLAKHHRLFIWSSNVRSVVERVLSKHELQVLFEKVVTRNDVRMIKPDPEGFGLLRDPAVPKSRYLLVGDSSSDRGAAQNAGIDFYHTDFFNQNV